MINVKKYKVRPIYEDWILGQFGAVWGIIDIARATNGVKTPFKFFVIIV